MASLGLLALMCKCMGVLLPVLTVELDYGHLGKRLTLLLFGTTTTHWSIFSATIIEKITMFTMCWQ